LPGAAAPAARPIQLFDDEFVGMPNPVHGII